MNREEIESHIADLQRRFDGTNDEIKRLQGEYRVWKELLDKTMTAPVVQGQRLKKVTVKETDATN